jgi:hypothetical protein
MPTKTMTRIQDPDNPGTRNVYCNKTSHNSNKINCNITNEEDLKIFVLIILFMIFVSDQAPKEVSEFVWVDSK